jgi:hypothetical protein
MVRTVFILLWDYTCQRGLSDDIAFSALLYPQALSLGSPCVFAVWPAMIWLGLVLQLEGCGGAIPVTLCAIEKRLVIE